MGVQGLEEFWKRSSWRESWSRGAEVSGGSVSLARLEKNGVAVWSLSGSGPTPALGTCAAGRRRRRAGGAEAALLPILSRSPCREPQLCAGGGTGERPPLGPPLAAPPPPPPGLDVRPPYPPRRPEAGGGVWRRSPGP